MLPALVLAVGLIVLYRLARKVQLYFSLRDFGGHWTAGWTRLWLLRVNNSGKMNEYFREINEKYGKHSLNLKQIQPRQILAQT